MLMLQDFSRSMDNDKKLEKKQSTERSVVRKITEVCSITFRSWEDQCWTYLERSVKAIKRQDSAEGPAVLGCRRREGRMR